MCPTILCTHVMYCDRLMTDVVPCGLQADGMHWQMLLPYDVVVDGKTTEADAITSS